MTDTPPDAIRLMGHYARRTGYAEAALEALCEQIMRMHEPPVSASHRSIRREWLELRTTVQRIQAAMERAND